jgi:type I restriction enzyme R subunit
MPGEVVADTIRQVIRTDSADLVVNNRAFHKMLTDGVDVSWRDNGRERHGKVWLIQRDPAMIDQNEFLAVNQFTVIEDKRKRRPDVAVFVNGLPLGVIELKNPAEEKATIRHAYNQLQTYKMDIPGFFTFNEMLVISDGFSAAVRPRTRRPGSLTFAQSWRARRLPSGTRTRPAI